MNATERARLISERKDPVYRKHRVWCKGEWREFDVYRVEVESLLLNVENRRFTAERQLMEYRLGRALDPEASHRDLRALIAILLFKNPRLDGDEVVGTASPDYLGLRNDWLNRRQETPFWIRPDGTVRNGNRRLAMVHLLREETGGDAHDWVEVIILDPDDINEDDLFEMEQREQLTENFKVRYTDINLLLTLREAASARVLDWGDPEDIERVAGELQDVAGGDKSYAVKQLRAIKYMDAFLDDSNASGEYRRLFRQVERFRDTGWLMSKMEQFPDHAPDMLRLAFAAIRAGNPHGHIRKLWKMFRDQRFRYEELLARIEQEEAPWEEARDESSLEDPDLDASEPDEDEDEESDGPGPSVTNYPKDRVRTEIENAVDGLVASGRSVLQQLTQALNRLDSVSEQDEGLADAIAGPFGEEVLEKLRGVLRWADEHRDQAG